MSTFSSLGISKWLCENLKSMEIHRPSDIQKACIPEILKGRDCIGGARTGSGKTIAFAAPMLTEWSKDPYGICGLILTPTRELALQIAEQFSSIGATINIKVCVIVGGVDMIKQSLELKSRPHFVVATPGRLADHISSSGGETTGGLKRIRYLVLDEADRLLSDSLANDLGMCMDALPEPGLRQTLLFTATITDQIRALADAPPKPGKQPAFLSEIPREETAIPKNLQQYYLLVPSYVKLAYLYSVLVHKDTENSTAIVFVNRTDTAEQVRRALQLLDVRVTSLHSQMPQQERLNALGRFRASAARVLIATDVASRGLDIPAVELVVNYDIPADPDDYIHRVGRTARAGRTGQAISLVEERDVDRIEKIETRVGTKMEEYKKVTDKAIVDSALKKVSIAKRQALMDMDRDHFGERRRIQKKKNRLRGK